MVSKLDLWVANHLDAVPGNRSEEDDRHSKQVMFATHLRYIRTRGRSSDELDLHEARNETEEREFVAEVVQVFGRFRRKGRLSRPCPGVSCRFCGGDRVRVNKKGSSLLHRLFLRKPPPNSSASKW